MGILRDIGCKLASPQEGKRARLLLFSSLIAIALVDARPNRAEERALITIGQRLCEASANGTPINPPRPETQRIPPITLAGIDDNLRRTLRQFRSGFSEGCTVKFWRGSLEADNGTDYVLQVSASNGDWLILELDVRNLSLRYVIFDIRDKGAGWFE